MTNYNERLDKIFAPLIDSPSLTLTTTYWDEAKQAINQAVKDHIIADIIGMCLETKHPGEFPSVDALMIRDKIVLKYLVTKGNE